MRPNVCTGSILLIDDDEDDQFLFTKAVEELAPDLTVQCLTDAGHINDVLQSATPSLIFIDYHLPKMTGIECLKLIRSQKRFENIPVIFWSGSCAPQNKSQAYAAGAQYYFEKPFYIQALVNELKKFFNECKADGPPAIYQLSKEKKEKYLAA